jgi:large subunit ribosomal protein L20
MPRVKGGVTTRARRKKILKLAKGYVGSRRLLYRTAHEQVMRSLNYAYRDRKQKKREFRKLWITRINAACKANNMKYSKFIHGLALANVQTNRKVLADLAVHQPEDFKAFVELAQNALNGVMPKAAKAKVKAVKEETAEFAQVIEPVEKVKAEVKKAPAKKAAATKETTEKAAPKASTKKPAAKKPATTKKVTKES